MRLRLVRIEPDELVMEVTYSGEAEMPPKHLHPKQAERFEILEGSMRTNIGNEERIYEAGEVFEVSAGTAHQMAAQGPTRMRWQVRPALRTAEFFERLYGEGPDSARELGKKFFVEFDEEFRLVDL
jgi:quercetin dioxygenase-like cupin family protein